MHHGRTDAFRSAAVFRPGTILPEAEETAPAGVSGIVPNLSFSIYPGECGAYELYEDDGDSTAYQTGAFVKTAIRHRKENSIRHIEILPASGKCKGFQHLRPLKLLLHGVVPPESVKITAELRIHITAVKHLR